MVRKLFMVLTFAALGSAAASGLPDTIAAKGATQPFWISAAAATDADGGIRFERFDAAQRLLLQSAIQRMEARAAERRPTATNDERCAETTLERGGGHGLDRTWSDLRKHASAIYVGTITDARQGFVSGVASSLYELRIDQRIRVAPGYPAGEMLYFSYPAADFTIGQTRFCNAGPRNFYTPSVGDRVVLFAFDPAADPAELFVPTKEDDVFFAHGEEVIAPTTRRNDTPSPLSFDALVTSAAKDDHRDAKERRGQRP